jgi:hypothetical protein
LFKDILMIHEELFGARNWQKTLGAL